MNRLLTLAALFACLELPAQTPKPVTTGQGTTGQGTTGQGTTGRVEGKDPAPVTQGKQDPKGKQDPQGKTGVTKTGVTETGGKPKDEADPIPVGADPEDLRAMRGAQAMLEAEKKLAELLKAGKIKGIDKVLPFEEIASWPYDDGLKGMPKSVKELDGKKVMMTGFMLPIDEVENIKEFLLVQSLWSCCYGQPPDINGTIRVVMQGKKRIDYKFDPIKVIGTFRVKATVEDGFCVDVYQLETTEVEVIR
jgi:hypothetical protein